MSVHVVVRVPETLRLDDGAHLSETERLGSKFHNGEIAAEEYYAKMREAIRRDLTPVLRE